MSLKTDEGNSKLTKIIGSEFGKIEYVVEQEYGNGVIALKNMKIVNKICYEDTGTHWFPPPAELPYRDELNNVGYAEIGYLNNKESGLKDFYMYINLEPLHKLSENSYNTYHHYYGLIFPDLIKKVDLIKSLGLHELPSHKNKAIDEIIHKMGKSGGFNFMKPEKLAPLKDAIKKEDHSYSQVLEMKELGYAIVPIQKYVVVQSLKKIWKTINYMEKNYE